MLRTVPFFLAVTVFVIVGVAHAQVRHALIVGNSLYERAPLANPVNDADDMAAVLRDLGFVVHLVKDAGLRELEAEVAAFGNRLRPGDVAVFFYAGHGVQLDGVPYLVPIDDDSATEAEIRSKSFSAQRVVDTIASAGVSLGVVVFDACRNNPYAFQRAAGTEGLATLEVPRGEGLARAGVEPVSSRDQDFAIIYSTQPGNVALDGIGGRNSPFAGALVDALRQRVYSFDGLLRYVTRAVREQTRNEQEPWISTSIAREYAFNFLAVQDDGRPPVDVVGLQPGQEAEFLAQVLAGGTVVLGGGTFTLPSALQFRQPVEIIGAGQGRTVLLWEGGGPLVAWDQEGTLKLRGLSLTYGGQAWINLVVARRGILELWDVEVSGGRRTGVHLEGGVSAHIASSSIWGNGGIGVAVLGQAVATLRGNVVRDNGGAGVEFRGFGSGVLESNVIERNANGVHNQGSGHPSVHGNTISHNARAGAASERFGTMTLMNNLISHNQGHGVQINDGVVVGNRIEANGADGTNVWGRVRLAENEIRSNAGLGVRMEHRSVGDVVSNLISENMLGGIRVIWASPLMQGNRVQDNGGPGIRITADPSRGFGTGGRVIENTVEGNEGIGILVLDNANVLLRENRIRTNELDGVAFAERAGGHVIGNLVEGNLRAGIALYDRSSPTLQDNHVRANAMDGIWYHDSSSGSAANNRLESNQGYGIAVTGEARPVLRENMVVSNTRSGIAFFEQARGLAEANTVDGNGGHGIFCGAEAGTRLNGNTLQRNTWYGLAMHTGSGCTHSGTRFAGNGYGEVHSWTP